MTAKARGGSHWVSNAACRIDQLEWAGQHLPVSLLQNLMRLPLIPAVRIPPGYATPVTNCASTLQHLGKLWHRSPLPPHYHHWLPLWRCKLDQAAIIEPSGVYQSVSALASRADCLSAQPCDVSFLNGHG
jgi:hypothetical protein